MIKRWRVDGQSARFFARMSGGSLQRALAFLDEDFDDKRLRALQFLESSLSEGMEKRILGAVALLNFKERTLIIEVLQLLQIWLRDLLFIQSGITDNLMNIDRVEELKRVLSKWPALNIERGLSSVEGAIDYLQKNVYLQLVIFSLAGKLYKCR
jgi:DNA polymerase-3 subunit delta'